MNENSFHNAKFDVEITKDCFFKLLDNKIVNPMNIKEQMTAIRAYLEMLSQADNISKNQINMFSEKIEAFFSSLEGFDFDLLEEQIHNHKEQLHNNNNTKNNFTTKISDSFDEMDDDLPF